MASHRATRRRRPVWAAIVATSGTLVALATVLAIVASSFIGGLARSFDAQSDTIVEAFPSGKRPAVTEDAQNILLIGSDSRSSSAELSDSTAGGRSDTLMLAHLPADRKTVYLMSIMRDSWVAIPGHGEAKINAAYSWGGVSLTVQTVEQLLDVRIDHVAEIDFAGFKGMTEALGGVTVQSPKEFTSQGQHFSAGANRLQGQAALAFVRARSPFADADHTRVRNQQAFMRGLLEGVLSRGTITSPRRIQDFVSATSAHLSVDRELTFRAIVALGWSLRHVRADDLTTFTVPTAGGGVSADGQSYVDLNDLEVEGLSSALRSDDIETWLAKSSM